MTDAPVPTPDTPSPHLSKTVSLIKPSNLMDLKTFILAISSVIIVWVPVLLLHLTLVLFSALIVYALVRGIANWIRLHIFAYLPQGANRGKFDGRAEWLGVLILTAVIALGVYIFGDWVAEKASIQTFNRLLTQILQNLWPTASVIARGDFTTFTGIGRLFFQTMLLATIKSHAPQLQLAGIHTLRGVGYVLAGAVIGGIVALQVPPHMPSTSKPLVRHLRNKFDELMAGFADVFFAQVKISSINTILTSVYLLGIMPLIGHPMPMAWTVVLITFCAGLFPVVGNLVSNVVIVLLSLTHGLAISIMSLVWLVSIHKLEYF